MKYSIAQIGANRLEKVLQKESKVNQNKLIEILKMDITCLLNSYFYEVENVHVSIKNNDEIDIKIEALATEFKNIGNVYS